MRWVEKNKKEQDNRNDRKEIAHISCTFRWRRELFGAERRSKKRERAEKWYRVTQKNMKIF